MVTRLHGGPMGTELSRRGFPLRAAGAWSAAAITEAPDLVAAIHRDHVRAGAAMVTANTTCAHAHYVGDAMPSLCTAAIGLARQSGAIVAGALSMLPATMSSAAREGGYAQMAAALVDADILLLEGFVDGPELLRALAATRAWVGPRWAALAGPGVAALPEIVVPARAEDVALLAVHCCDLDEAVAALVAAQSVGADTPLGAYPSPDTDDCAFANALVGHARALSLSWIGSCCGGTPATTAAIASALAERPAQGR